MSVAGWLQQAVSGLTSRFVNTVEEGWRRAPLVYAATGLIVGIALGSRSGGGVGGPEAPGGVNVAFAAGAGVLVFVAGWAGAAVFRRTIWAAALLVATGCAGGGLTLERIAARRLASGIGLYAETPFCLARVRGTVVKVTPTSTPRAFVFDRYLPAERRGALMLDVRRIERFQGWVRTSGLVRVTCNEPLLDVRPGDEVEAFGRLYAFRPAANPGGFDAAAHYHGEGIGAGLSCESAANIRLAEGAAWSSRTIGLERLRAWFRRLLTEDWPDVTEGTRGLLETMVLGHRATLDRRIDRLFTELGVSHLLAVSGAQVAAIAWGAWFAARLLGFQRRAAAGLTFAATAVYAGAAEPSAPILRAVVVCGLVSFGFGIGRAVRPVNLLALACFLLLLIRPGYAFSAAFQLSFAAALGIVALTPAASGAWGEIVRWVEDRRHGPLAAELRRRLAAIDRPVVAPKDVGPLPVWRLASRLRGASGDLPRRAGRVVGLSIAVSVSAWAATAPLVAWHFHQIQWAGPLNTLALSLPVTLMIDAGFAAILLSVVSPEAALPLKGVLFGLQETILRVAEALPRGYPWIMSASRPSWAGLVGWYAALAFAAWRFRRTSPPLSREHRFEALKAPEPASRRGKSFAVALTCAAALIAGGWAAWGRGADRALTMTALSVGRGLAVVIELPDGRTLLYDAGSDARYDVGSSVIAPFLRSRGVLRVDAVYVSHANLDHFSGLPGLIDALPTGPVILTPYFLHGAETGSPARRLIDVLCAAGHPVEVEDLEGDPATERGGVRIERVWPPPGLPSHVEANETSLVLRLTFGGRSVLLTGDIEDEAQRSLMLRGELDADVLVLPHHGSPRASTDRFVEHVRPSIVVQSARGGAGAVLERFTTSGRIRAYNTGDDGAVTVRLSESGVEASGLHGARR
ncbi:MAG: hypothetical protein FLDDKLPJ_01719 [Phycisphaerae bacterium]|nr:hypothetical protein [Phycisphaerae bacterium]